MYREIRTMERLREHYEIEKALAKELKNSNKKERKYLYTQLYDELFKKVPDHPQLVVTDDLRKLMVMSSIRILRPFLNKKITFLEIGPGDCSLSFEVAKYVKGVVAIDVSKDIVNSYSALKPLNLELIISDGVSIDVEKESIDVAYSNQLMEHLHPDDAMEQMKNIYTSLAPNGIYICRTPHRFSGPHDISKYFDEIATGFHLKEYTHSELQTMFKMVGFSRVEAIIGAHGLYFKISEKPLVLIEKILNNMNKSMNKVITHNILLQPFLGIQIIATK